MPLNNLLPSQRNGVIGVVDPDANTVGDKDTVWMDAAAFDSMMAIIQTGILGASATVDAKLLEATDAAGAGAKDITGKAITQLLKASNDDDQAIINLRADELDVDNGFAFVLLRVTIGTATSDCSAVVLGLDPRYAPADANGKDLASVVEIVE